MHTRPKTRSLVPPPIAALALLIALQGFAAAAETSHPRLGTEPLRPTAQAIHLTLDPQASGYRGTVEIHLAVSSETERIRFHSLGHELKRVSLSGGGESGGDGSVVIKSVVIESKSVGEGIVEIRTEKPIPPGPYLLAIDFEASFGSQLEGLYTVEQEGARYALSVFQPIGARRAFPCWDEPELKIPFQVTLTVPEENLAISTGREEEVSIADGWRTVRFRPTPPVPSYGVSFAVGPFDTVPIDGLGVPGRLITAQGKGHLAPRTAAAAVSILRTLERYLGQPYPYDKLDLIAAPGFPNGGLENPAAVVFSEDVLLLDPSTASPSRRRNQAVLLAHELSHMWFGNLVTLKWWDDVWLNESFATWMAYKVVDEVFPELRIDALRQRRIQRAYELDAQVTAPPIRRELASPQEAFTVSAPLVYEKGSQVLRMIETWVGAEKFQEGVEAYLKQHAWGNADAADFWRAIDRSSGKNPAAALAAFLEQPGFPLIDVEVRGGRAYLRQQRFAEDGKRVEALSWKAPVALKLISGSSTRVETLLLAGPAAGPAAGSAPGAEPASLGSFDLIYPKASAAGYYRWRLPVDELRALAAVAANTLSSSERLDLVSNCTALLQAGKLPSDVYLHVLTVMAADPDPVVVSAVIDALGRVHGALVIRELEKDYSAYLRQTLRPAWEHFGPEPTLGEAEMVAQLRSELYLVLGRDGRDEGVRRHARETVEALLARDGGSSASPPALHRALISPALQLAALDGGQDLFSAYRNRLKASDQSADRHDLVRALASFPNAELRRAALDLFVEGALDPEELMILAATLQEDASGGDLLLAWLMEHHEAIAARLPPFLQSYLPLFAGGCSAERLVQAEAFFAQETHRVAGTERQLAQVAERVRDCVRLGERERPTVERYLARLVEGGASEG